MNNNYMRDNSRHRYSPYGPHANTNSHLNDNEDEILSAKSGPGQLGGLPVLSNMSQLHTNLENPLLGGGTDMNNTFENNNLSGNQNLSHQFYAGGRGPPPDFTSYKERRDSPDNMLENARGALDGGRFNNNNYLDKEYKQQHFSDNSRERN